MIENRKTLLEKAICLDGDFNKVVYEISKYDFDTHFPIVIITGSDIISIVDKYLNKIISDRELQIWANFFECRDDVDFERPIQEKLRRIVQELANPELFVRLDREYAKNVKRRILAEISI